MEAEMWASTTYISSLLYLCLNIINVIIEAHAWFMDVYLKILQLVLYDTENLIRYFFFTLGDTKFRILAYPLFTFRVPVILPREIIRTIRARVSV